MSFDRSSGTFGDEIASKPYAQRLSTASARSNSLFSTTSLEAIMSSRTDENHNSAQDGRLLALKVVGKINLRIERQSYDELTRIINQIPGEVLMVILHRLALEDLLKDIPNSLSVLSAFYVKLYKDCSENGFSIKQLNCEDIIHHLVSYFTEIFKFNDQTYFSARSKDFMRNILFVCSRLDTGLRDRLQERVKILSSVLEGFSAHTLVEIVSRSSAMYYMRLHEALKIEIERAVAHYKAAIQKLAEVFHNIPHQTFEGAAISADAKREELEKRSAESTREMTQQLIEDRLVFNQSVLNAVETKTRNPLSVGDLMGKLRKRVHNDKEVLQVLSQLRKEFAITKEYEKVLPLFERYRSAYVMLLQLLDEGTSSRGMDTLPKVRVSRRVSGSTSSADEYSEGGGSDTDVFDTVTQLDEDTEMSALSSHDSGDSETQSKSDITVVQRDRTLTCIQLNDDLSAQLAVLQRDLHTKQSDLEQAQQRVAQLTEREKELSDRLADQAARQLKKGGKFEDLSEGECRPTALVDRYDNLYTQTRLDALDGLDELEAFTRLVDDGDIKSKLLFSVVVVAFRTVQNAFTEKQYKLRKLLGLAESGQEHVVEEQVTTYLRQTANKFKLDHINKDVSTQLWSTLYDFPELKGCPHLQTYIEECVRVAWMASVQVPPLTIEYDAMDFSPNLHARIYTSNTENTQIQYYIWPALIDSRTGGILYKATVAT